MLKKLFVLIGLLSLSLVIIGCSDTSTSDNITNVPTTTQEPTTFTPTTEELMAQPPTVESGYLVSDVQDGLILHAWNWSLETIEMHLEEIAIAGFSTIQISPMQPQKDFFGIALWGDGWWRLYQPLGFVIATSDHSIGTLADLESLTDAADDYGINIIVDIIANHLSSDSSSVLDPDVQTYEPEIYNQDLIRTSNGQTSDTSVFAVTKGSLGGLVDLQTENDIVQQAVLDLLKDYVDAGVDGFRFDAAKHIETENDGDYASDFWSTIIEGIETYATSDIYIYGEILNTPGSGRSYADYTPYMSITTNTISDQIRNAVATENASRLEDVTYLSEVPANQSVLWAESHDDYAAGHTDGLSDAIITRTYVIEASRKDATTLYFARPKSSTLMGEVGTYTWQSIEVNEINRFHNYFVGADENISIQNGFFINERFSDDKEGVVIVDVDGTGSIDGISVTNLSDGWYLDQISDEWFRVVDGELQGSMGEHRIAIIYNNPYEVKPVVYVSDDGNHGTFTDTKEVTIYSYNTTEAYYSMNGGEQVNFSGDVVVELTHPELNAIVTLQIDAFYGDYHISKTYTYEKSNIVIEEVVVNNLDPDEVEGYEIVAWTWQTGSDGEWVEGEYNDGTFTFDLPEGNDWFLLVLFPSGTTSYNWQIKVFQTGDISIPSDGIYDGSQITWN